MAVETIQAGVSQITEDPLLRDITEHRTDLDSHADTCLVGKNAVILEELDRYVNISGFDPSKGKANDLQIVNAAVAFDDPETGQPYILRVNQAVSVPTLENNLLCPMQLRMNDITINECPKFLTKSPTDNDHAILLPISNDEHIRIRLHLSGVTSYFYTRKPTERELNDGNIDQFDLTYTEPEWEPWDKTFEDQEEATVGIDDLVHDEQPKRPRIYISSVLHTQY